MLLSKKHPQVLSALAAEGIMSNRLRGETTGRDRGRIGSSVA